MKGQKLLKCALVLAAVVVLGMMVKRYQTKSVVLNEEFQDNGNDSGEVNPSDNGNNAGPGPVTDAPSTPPPVQCQPRDRLTADDLLPKDAANSQFAQANPAGQGDADSKNHLTAGYTLGVNSVGNSLRNANRQLRSEPPNPQLKVSPWMNTTIGPDLGRRPLE
tara:strand:+ start:1648 stop:2136 length:489 start_codon:yes stop_codon:yes gene_type:complete